VIDTSSIVKVSKKTYGQTYGLSNLEMKHVDELAIIGVLLKSVKTSRVHTMQGYTHLTNVGFFAGFCCTHSTNTYVQNS